MVRDFYPTPKGPADVLIQHLMTPSPYTRPNFYEPCAGDGALVRHLIDGGLLCDGASDIEPVGDDIKPMDVMDIELADIGKDRGIDLFITNPPWPAKGQGGDPSIAMALHLSDMLPTWLLLNADIMHNKYFLKVIGRCETILSVGRVKWIPGSAGPGKENCAWFKFDANHFGPTRFFHSK